MIKKISKKFVTVTTALVSMLFINGCAFVYQPDVQQGNYITEEMLEKIQLGMSKTEVEYYLGRPLVQDPFHNDRWDYFYSYRERRNSNREERNLVLYFQNESLVKIDGNIETEQNLATTPAAPELKKPDIDPETLTWYEKIFSK